MYTCGKKKERKKNERKLHFKKPPFGDIMTLTHCADLVSSDWIALAFTCDIHKTKVYKKCFCKYKSFFFFFL